MKKTIYKSSSRGQADHGWLKARFSFSFAEYQNPECVHFGALRVLNDDIIAPGMGFGTHPHNNMEIITIPLKGALAHKDSMGNGSVIGAGEVQVMSAGSGITHSEYNASDSEQANTLQIWIFSDKKDVEPRYDQQKYSFDIKNKFYTLVSPNGADNSLFIHQKAYISRAIIEENKIANYQLKAKQNGVYAFTISGCIVVDGVELCNRDAMAITETSEIQIQAQTNADILLIEVPLH